MKSDTYPGRNIMNKFGTKKKYFIILCLLFIISQIFATPTIIANQNKSEPIQALQESDENEIGTLFFTGSYQLRLGKKDKYGRATAAHIQLQYQHQPKKKREGRLTYNPVGWHNYKFYYGNGKQKTWLMNRGHLIGYQFSGLNDEGRNLVPLTAWLNTGTFKGTDENNSDSMLYYEKRLDQWLEANPNNWLDYKVTPIYHDDELLPRQIELQFVGLDMSGNIISIHLGGKESIDQDGMSHVLLDNLSPNAELNYQKGTAKNTMDQNSSNSAASSENSSASIPSESNTNSLTSTEQEKTVYVARQGTAQAYWYDINHMPSNTNFDNVVTMTESQAISQGKHHSSKE